MAKLCRLCLKPVNDFRYTIIRNEEIYSEHVIKELHTCIPEMNLHLTKESLICGSCTDTLDNYYYFKNSCLESEKLICNYMKQMNTNALNDLNETMQIVNNQNILYIKEESNSGHDVKEKYNVNEFVSANVIKVVNTSELVRNEDNDVPNSELDDDNITVKEELHKEEDMNISETEVNIVNHDTNTLSSQEINTYISSMSDLNNAATDGNQNTPSSELFVCTSCEAAFSSKCELLTHMQYDCGKVFVCGLCVFRSTTKSDFEQHLQVHKKGKFFHCDTCGYECLYKSHMVTHLKFHTGEKPFQCDRCDYKCTDKSSLQRHIRTHTGEKPFQCERCDYICSNKSLLRKHLKVHVGEKPLECEQCDYTCLTKSDLERHLITHTEKKTFQCEFCYYQYTDKSNYRRHIKIHVGERPFQCLLCDYRCSEKGDLKRHLRIHTGEKPYRCDQCDYRCSHKSNLKQHLRVHTGEKPFHCEHCTYKSASNSLLKKHSRIHTGEKPFYCGHCGHTCSSSSNLKRHLKLHTDQSFVDPTSSNEVNSCSNVVAPPPVVIKDDVIW